MHSTGVECTDFIGENELKREDFTRVRGRLCSVASDGRAWLNAWSPSSMACMIGMLA